MAKELPDLTSHTVFELVNLLTGAAQELVNRQDYMNEHLIPIAAHGMLALGHKTLAAAHEASQITLARN